MSTQDQVTIVQQKINFGSLCLVILAFIPVILLIKGAVQLSRDVQASSTRIECSQIGADRKNCYETTN